ncbi:unnamed protein product, partial [Chrysoparadoxa australica]
QGFTRFVEIGRVCLVNYGPDQGKLCVIIDVVDKNKALVDGPDFGVARQMMTFKRLSLTDLKVEIFRNARQGTLRKAIAAADVSGKWEATSWAKKLAAKKKRASMTDLDRFKVMVARKQKSRIVAKKLASMK